MTNEYLVGYTGFVGSNIASEHSFSGLFNSVNIREAYGGKPEILVYAGVPAEMYSAVQNPEKDMDAIKQAMNNIEQINPKHILLISTVAVYSETKGVDEDTQISPEVLTPYGANRFILEQWVSESFLNHTIIRLPALFGKNIKKNFLYDYIHPVPKIIRSELYEKMVKRENVLSSFYQQDGSGFYRCRDVSLQEEISLKESFQKLNFSALNFTDSRSRYQFFNLKHLWNYIDMALNTDIQLLNIATVPIGISELYNILTGKEFVNFSAKHPYDYDIKSKYAELFGGANGYMQSKESVVSEIKAFLRDQGATVR